MLKNVLTVGLANIWRFPYLCFKYGGGAFLIPYFVSLFIIGFPLLYLETAIGQFTSLDFLSCWNIAPIFRGIGYSCMIMSFMIGVLYNVIVAEFLQYLFYSWKTLPWTTCDNAWNVNCTSGEASKQFFYNKVVQLTDSIGDMGRHIPGVTGTYAVCWYFVFINLCDYKRSTGKIVYGITLSPYIMITILLITGVNLKGSKEGIKFYLKPDFSQLLRFDIWEAATSQIFFSLSACCGGIITMSSHKKYKNKFLIKTIIVGSLDSFTSFYCGFAIFSATGHLAYLSNKTVSEVTKLGTSLSFIGYSASISNLSGAQFWSVIFYLVFFSLGLKTVNLTAENLIFPVENYFVPNSSFKRRAIIRGLFCILSFLCGIPMMYQGGFYYIDVLSHASSSGFIWVAISELICLIYVYDYRNLLKEIEFMTGKKNGIAWKALFIVIVPLAALFILISNYVFYAHSESATTSASKGINLFLSLLCILPIPIYAISYGIYCCIYKKSLTQPNSQWIERQQICHSEASNRIQ